MRVCTAQVKQCKATHLFVYVKLQKSDDRANEKTGDVEKEQLDVERMSCSGSLETWWGVLG